jgi:hypothetical protein
MLAERDVRGLDLDADRPVGPGLGRARIDRRTVDLDDEVAIGR